MASLGRCLCALLAWSSWADLAAGGSLSRLRRAAGALGFGRERPVRILRAVRPLRPRRAVCHPCAKTHVLLPAWSVRHRRDGTEVIIAALLDAAAGQGHRMIAARLAVAAPVAARPRSTSGPSAVLYELEPPEFGLDPRVAETGSTLCPEAPGVRRVVDDASCARSRFPMKTQIMERESLGRIPGGRPGPWAPRDLPGIQLRWQVHEARQARTGRRASGHGRQHEFLRC